VSPVGTQVWERRDVVLDIECGDLFQTRFIANRCELLPRPIFADVVLRRPDQNRRAFPQEITERSSNRRPNGRRRVEDSISAEKLCTQRLVDEMTKSRAVRVGRKADYSHQAKKRWPILGTRAFDRCWQDAVRLADAPAWSRAGAPRKNQRARKSPR
jgi:hypothetical protein